MRLRRHGSAETVQRRGPKSAPDPSAKLFLDISPRSRARLARALRLNRWLEETLGEQDHFTPAVAAATRANGSVSFAKVLRIIEVRGAMLLALAHHDRLRQ